MHFNGVILARKVQGSLLQSMLFPGTVSQFAVPWRTGNQGAEQARIGNFPTFVIKPFATVVFQTLEFGQIFTPEVYGQMRATAHAQEFL